jgi:hypothetical protein
VSESDPIEPCLLHFALASLLLAGCCLLGMWPPLFRLYDVLNDRRAWTERERKWNKEFDDYDKNKDGTLDLSELRFACPAWFPDDGITRADFLQLMELMHDGTEEPATLERALSGDEIKHAARKIGAHSMVTRRKKSDSRALPEQSTQCTTSTDKPVDQANPGGSQVIAQIHSTLFVVFQCCADAAQMVWHKLKFRTLLTLVPSILRFFLLLLALQFVPVTLLGPFELFMRDVLDAMVESPVFKTFPLLALLFGPEMMQCYVHGLIGALACNG